jgi:hypothetical protein
MAIINIIRVYELSTPEERLQGIKWYEEARKFVHTLDPQNPHRAAGIVSALSPMRTWKQNVTAAGAFYSGRRNIAMTGAIRKCEAILEADPSEIPGILNGPKIKSFYDCIIDKDSLEVCIDRHALDVSRGYSVLYKNEHLRSTFLARKGNYEKVQAEYRKAAKVLDLLPRELQAITWLAWRRLKLSNPRTNMNLREVMNAAA